MRRRCLALLCLIWLAGCSSGAASSSEPSPSPSSERKKVARGLQEAEAPEVRLSAGMDSAVGVLVSWCRDASCRSASGVRPARYVDVADGVIVFVASREPGAATVTQQGSSEPTALRPGTTMAFAGSLPRGRSTITLVARWGKNVGTYVFGVRA